MKYLDIAVFTTTENNADIFTYHTDSDKGITTGRVVKVPFKNRSLFGIILNTNAIKPKFETKEISEILDDSLTLPKHLIKTAYFISEHYHAPLSLALKTMLPRGFYKKRRSSNTGDVSTVAQVEKKIILTKEQKKVFEHIISSKNKKPFLLHGITGSGKTEIYLRAIDEAIKKGQEAIILVPEIALTPQTIRRFDDRFPGLVTVLHSRLKETEKHSNWNDLKEGKKRIVVGSRSAIFAPLTNLGIIIIDEEHETSYKQESTPRYDTRKVAAYIAKETNSKLILGSATPNIEDYHKSQNNEYILLSLNKRVTQHPLPSVKIVDLSKEFATGRKSFLSLSLEEKIGEILDNKRKIVLFLNRRGSSTYVFCRECGYIEKCPHCDIPLTYHQINKALSCHHCDFKKEDPTKCPECRSSAIKYYGLGLQKVETDLKELFPKAKIVRMDRDSVKERDAHRKLYESFKNDSDILIGTQMIAKGWDIPEVDLVGVLLADVALNFPDYRSSERTFQLLTQIAGRTGRGEKKGEVIIQTYNPDNFSIQCTKDHDYTKFYEKEISDRKMLRYPPFSRIIKFEYKNKDEDKAKNEAFKVKDSLEKMKETKYNDISIDILGPSPAFIYKVKGYYKWQMVVKMDKETKKSKLEEFLKIIPKNWSIDIDPINLV